MAPEESACGFERVAILGLGLMGGSLARAVRALHPPSGVVGWSPDADEARRAEKEGAISRAAADAEDAAAGADLVVVATPLEAALRLLTTLPGVLAPGALVTDVVSLKVPVRDAIRSAGLGPRWVGSHPMCGGERSGFAASRVDLYRDARVWIVAEGASGDDVRRLEAFWHALGALPRWIDAEEHDTLMGLASHLPQLAANALARVLEEAGVHAADLGPGGRDATRLAGSSPEVWGGLLAHAPVSLGRGLRSLAQHVDALADLVERRDLEALASWMAATRTWRENR